VSSPVMNLDLLLKISPDEVFFDFLAQCGLTLNTVDAEADDDTCEKLRIAVEIERAPLWVRDSILVGLHHIALLADEAGLDALRTVAAAAPGRVTSLHLSDAPAQCALWMYLRHRDLFDAACRMRGRLASPAEPMMLDCVRQPLTLPDDPSVGSARLREVTLLDETTGGEITIKASGGQVGVGVLDLLAGWMPIDNLMRQERFQVIAAKVDLAFLPDASGRPARRRSQLILKRRGGHNLADFDAALRARLEAWLSLGQSAFGAESNAGQLQQTI
jgi:hypothetical protein